MKIFKIIKNLFSDQSHKYEQEMIKIWHNESAENLELLKNQLSVEQLSDELIGYDKYNKENAWEKISQKTIANPKKVKRLAPSYKVAASILFLLFAGYFLKGTIFEEATDQIVYTADKAQQNIVLKDGSKIILDAQSELTEEAFRAITLKGRAYFKVTPDMNNTFKIKTAAGTISVLGTAFSLNTTDLQTEVYVTEGKVKVQNADEEKLLLKGDYVILSQNAIVIQNVIPDNYLGWISRSIIFKDANIQKVAEDLSEFYNTKIVINTNIAVNSCKVNTKFSGETLSEALEELKLIIGLQYKITESGIHFTSIKC